MNVLIQRTDLAGSGLCTHSGFHRTAIPVANHKHDLDTKDSGSVFETGDGSRSCKVSRNAHNEQMPDRLIKDEFDWYPGVSTGEDGREWLLLFNRIGAQDLQVLLQRRELLRLKAAIALRQDRHRLAWRC